ncbi:hypothetical protein ABID21_003893 [Pseudorhizobium tarimense]|uniref:Uncharacterized protein n=1 Tax=Pseudorhizobium tarimense TaxID=1079109 RepID=A0ABV2HBH9_9HYPH
MTMHQAFMAQVGIPAAEGDGTARYEEASWHMT